jgi:murein L,D-transpeptidase YcbB/YkuD
VTQTRWTTSCARLVRYACLGLTLVGCAHIRTAEKAASVALGQLDIYDRDIGAKIRAESNYYEEVMAAARANTSDLWRNEQPARFEQEAKAFTRANQRFSAEAADAELADLLKAFMTSWARRDAEYAALLGDTVRVLNDNRKKLEVEQARIGQLRGKLMTLSEAASDKEMLKLAIGFVKETKDKLDELSKDSKTASDPSKPATGR